MAIHRRSWMLRLVILVPLIWFCMIVLTLFKSDLPGLYMLKETHSKKGVKSEVHTPLHIDNDEEEFIDLKKSHLEEDQLHFKIQQQQQLQQQQQQQQQQQKQQQQQQQPQNEIGKQQPQYDQLQLQENIRKLQLQKKEQEKEKEKIKLQQEELKKKQQELVELRNKLLKIEPQEKPAIVAIPSGPGEGGAAVEIKPESLNPEDKARYELGWKNNQFNQYASDMISLHRYLPDYRHQSCKAVTYPSRIPDTTVIIIFYNEAWTTLLRTVHSVLDRSPPELINEIILVDDFSTMDHLKQMLDDYLRLNNLDKVRVLRNDKREGLIRARLNGAAVAKGEVLTFLDSHCECTTGWLEPLLGRIAEDTRHVVTPVIDTISDKTMAFLSTGTHTFFVGGFDWALTFNWHQLPAADRKLRKTPADPARSPTMAGGLFSIHKKYFEHLGKYDPGMEIWGAENLELSFRIWMCGGTLEVMPCSRVGHIFRSQTPYVWKPGTNVLQVNTVRLAEVWVDEYKKYYYDRINWSLGEYGDVSERKQLRKDLQCKSFEWYLNTIYPDLQIPDYLASGEIRNQERDNLCVDGGKAMVNKPMKLYYCHGSGGNQYWMLSPLGEIRRDEFCLDYVNHVVMNIECGQNRPSQRWTSGVDNTLRHQVTGLCLTAGSGLDPQMKECTGEPLQVWNWKWKDPSINGPLPPVPADVMAPP